MRMYNPAVLDWINGFARDYVNDYIVYLYMLSAVIGLAKVSVYYRPKEYLPVEGRVGRVRTWNIGNYSITPVQWFIGPFNLQRTYAATGAYMAIPGLAGMFSTRYGLELVPIPLVVALYVVACGLYVRAYLLDVHSAKEVFVEKE